MPQFGEAVSVLIDTDTALKCPFCNAQSDANTDRKEMVNDSKKLAENAGGRPLKLVFTPEATEEYDIADFVWKDDTHHEVITNAHHIIPGNASLARCPQILKWMASYVSIKKNIYDKRIEKTVKKVPKKDQNKQFKKLAEQKYKNMVMVGDPEGIVLYSIDETNQTIERFSKPVTENYVTGKIEFDVNDRENCVWLPSHCAVDGWGKLRKKKVKAWRYGMKDSDLPIAFEVAYAYNTMLETYKQFHDAHEDYSIQVIEELKNLNTELEKLREDCLQHPNSKCKEKPYPAPTQLTKALHKLAELICEKELDLNNKRPEHPWITSRLSLDVAEEIDKVLATTQT